jgi:hypothetical protein
MTNSQGYVLIRVPEDHYLRCRDGYAREHQVVAEKKIGRRLRPDEIVHHKNDDRTDNRPENLEVKTRSEHSRIHCQERWDTGVLSYNKGDKSHMSKAKKKQTEMVGTQADKLPALENAICDWRETVDERMSLTEREIERRDVVDGLLKKHGFTSGKPYIYSDGEERYKVFLPTSEVHAKCKRISKKKAKGDEDNE